MISVISFQSISYADSTATDGSQLIVFLENFIKFLNNSLIPLVGVIFIAIGGVIFAKDHRKGGLIFEQLLFGVILLISLIPIYQFVHGMLFNNAISTNADLFELIKKGEATAENFGLFGLDKLFTFVLAIVFPAYLIYQLMKATVSLAKGDREGKERLVNVMIGISIVGASISLFYILRGIFGVIY